MEWTTTKPSEPGWYWRKPLLPADADGLLKILGEPGVVFVYENGSDLCFEGRYGEAVPVDEASDMTWLWCGPLTPPPAEAAP